MTEEWLQRVERKECGRWGRRGEKETAPNNWMMNWLPLGRWSGNNGLQQQQQQLLCVGEQHVRPECVQTWHLSRSNTFLYPFRSRSLSVLFFCSTMMDLLNLIVVVVVVAVGVAAGVAVRVEFELSTWKMYDRHLQEWCWCSWWWWWLWEWRVPNWCCHIQ